jgi:hypothetical protein
MSEDYEVTAKTVLNCAVGRFRDADKSDLLILTLRVAGEDLPFAMDRRIAEYMAQGLAETAKKLTAPRNEH